MVMYVLLRLIAVILLVALNAFFVAAEFALVSVRSTRIEQLIAAKRIGARTVQRLHNNVDSVLNGVQFGITIASLALGWVGVGSLAHVLEPALHGPQVHLRSLKTIYAPCRSWQTKWQLQ